MYYCLVKNNIITNVVTIQMDNLDGFLKMNPEYRELPPGKWIGDVFDDTLSSIESLQEENKLLKAQLRAQTERSDFIEDCIAEMATVVYGGV